jgi:hypothetical protein
MVNVNQFENECECIYKTERYSVRDNGSILRHPNNFKRNRRIDGIWTFGKLNDKTGYLEIASVRIHRIIATVFLGEPTTKEHVVDHIDTNKQNNRPDNLRWVTRLENVLLNPITARRIELVCGSVEAFLDDPGKFRDKFEEPNRKWMCAVSSQEAQLSKERLLAWAFSGSPLKGGTLGEWIFNRGFANGQIEIKELELTDSLTPNAVQRNWKTPTAFHFCPERSTNNPIASYAEVIRLGEVFSCNQYENANAVEFAVAKDGNTLWVVCEFSSDDSIKPWSLVQITFENNLFVHTSLGTFFDRVGAEKQFTVLQGLEWKGGDSIDDYC